VGCKFIRLDLLLVIVRVDKLMGMMNIARFIGLSFSSVEICN